MVTTAAVNAAHPDWRKAAAPRTNTSNANGSATSAILKSPGAPPSLSIKGGNSGVRRPVTMPAAATFRRSLREVSEEAIARSTFTSLCSAPCSSTVTAVHEIDVPRTAPTN